MQHFETTTQSTEPAPATAEADCASTSSEAVISPAATGVRLDAARFADRTWRAEFSRQLHQRLARIRQAESLVLRGGVGLSGVLVVAGLVTAILGASINVYMPLLAGALVSVAGTWVLVMAIAAWEARLGDTMTHADVMEECWTEESPLLAPMPLFEGAKGKNLGKRLLWLAHLFVAGLVLWFVCLVVWIVAG